MFHGYSNLYLANVNVTVYILSLYSKHFDMLRIGQILKETSGNMLPVLLIYTSVVLKVTAQMNITPLGNATSSSVYYWGKPQNAIEPPESNKWNLHKCTHTRNVAYRMDGFKIYVTNTSTIPPDGYLCYEDPDPGLPNITQTIPCFQLGKYVIYYDTKGDGIYGTWGPIVELCYVAIKGCQETFWGSNCTRLCPESCIHQHCYPGNGSCIWGCKDENCLNDVCDKDTLVCKGGCKGRLTGQYCNECPPSYYGNLCQSRCPLNCSGQCDLETDNVFMDASMDDAQCFTDSKMTNCTPEIYQLNPLSGPLGGGTILTISGKYIGSVNDSISIDISGVRCRNVTIGKPYFNLTCVTGKINTNQANGIFVSVNSKTFNDSDNSYFSYKNPTILDFSPTKSFLSGNTTVTIKGPNIGFEGRNRYNISFCDMYNCIACSTFPDTFSSNYIKCKTGNSSKTRNMTRLQVKIDDLTMLQFNGTFRYLPDPKFNIFNRSPKAQLSGGATFTIRGEGFYNDKHCDILEDTSVVCKTPQNRRNQPNNQTVHVHFDDLTLPVNVEYVEDPTFEKFPVVYEYDKESSIQIKGRNILSGARLEDYRIHVGLDGSCLLTDIDMQLITCFPPKSVPRTNKTDLNTVHVIVDVGNIKAYIGDLHYKVDINTLAITVGFLTAALITAVVISVFAVIIIRKKKKRTIKEFKIELMTREEMIREASREEFADAQINIKNIKSDLVTSSVPFRDYQTYILHQLFPNQDIRANHLLRDLEVTSSCMFCFHT
ncbi:unnamed protein product [Mytilus edulis]|uniref:IPT/TIG domain-containing protein n=1 Tax=Mytilus edulis TaxID=6550 RepID=A0A8S3RDX4_MYTED|nr:unnamed protein product [Mytilus edulis]